MGGDKPTPLARAREVMLQRLRQGSTFRDACSLAGVGWRDWKRWRKVVEVDGGTTGDPDKDALVRDAREAHSAATADLMAAIVAKSPDDWKAAAWAVEYRQGAARRASDQRRAHHEARLAAAAADKAAAGVSQPVVVIELPASLVRPREAS
jgi:hypothetical protein